MLILKSVFQAKVNNNKEIIKIILKIIKILKYFDCIKIINYFKSNIIYFNYVGIIKII